MNRIQKKPSKNLNLLNVVICITHLNEENLSERGRERENPELFIQKLFSQQV